MANKHLATYLNDHLAGSITGIATEAVSLGVEGKRLLWRALSAASANDPALRGRDYNTLTRRAESQRERLEAVRLQAAKAALAGAS